MGSRIRSEVQKSVFCHLNATSTLAQDYILGKLFGMMFEVTLRLVESNIGTEDVYSL
jgi:hypothetical protein